MWPRSVQVWIHYILDKRWSSSAKIMGEGEGEL